MFSAFCLLPQPPFEPGASAPNPILHHVRGQRLEPPIRFGRRDPAGCAEGAFFSCRLNPTAAERCKGREVGASLIRVQHFNLQKKSSLSEIREFGENNEISKKKNEELN
jgi:hypothetical protein